MYASVRHYEMGAGSIDSLMHHVDEEFAPALTQEPGFVCYFALDTGDETVETISVFHDKASADRSNELAAEYVRDNLREFELRRTGVTAGEVLVSRVAPEALEDAHHPSPHPGVVPSISSPHDRGKGSRGAAKADQVALPPGIARARPLGPTTTRA